MSKAFIPRGKIQNLYIDNFDRFITINNKKKIIIKKCTKAAIVKLNSEKKKCYKNTTIFISMFF